MRLEGKVAIITGGAKGIGESAVQIFTREGAKVVFCDWDEETGKKTEAKVKQAGYDVTFIKADVSNEEDVLNVVNETIRIHGRIDILYNNAGMGYGSGLVLGSVVQTPLPDWNVMISVNLNGPCLFAKHVIPQMVKQNGGSIVNTSSMNALIGNPNTSDSYTAAKGGILSLTRSWAADWAKDNIRVNCICPGPIQTPLLQPALDHPDRGHEHYNVRTLLGRVGQPEEVANAALFLASDEASYITGAYLSVDGGWTAF